MLHLGGDILSFRAKKVPKQTPLKAQDPENRLAYAKNGPILNGGIFGVDELSDDWDIRKTELGFLDHKPWWLDSSSAKIVFITVLETRMSHEKCWLLTNILPIS